MREVHAIRQNKLKYIMGGMSDKNQSDRMNNMINNSKIGSLSRFARNSKIMTQNSGKNIFSSLNGST